MAKAVNSKEAHLERCTVRALQVLVSVGFEPDDARVALVALRGESHDYCVSCGYKKKAATGTVSKPEELLEVDSLDLIIRNPQRDGDIGDLDRRLNINQRVLRALYEAGRHGLTDDELVDVSGVLNKSAPAARVNLMAGGWVRMGIKKDHTPLERKAFNSDSKMKVWVLTRVGRQKIESYA